MPCVLLVPENFGSPCLNDLSGAAEFEAVECPQQDQSKVIVFTKKNVPYLPFVIKEPFDHIKSSIRFCLKHDSKMNMWSRYDIG